jgi:hypothetical protein
MISRGSLVQGANNVLDDGRQEVEGGWTTASKRGFRAAQEFTVVIRVHTRGAAEGLSAAKLASPRADNGFAVLAIGLTRRVVSSTP